MASNLANSHILAAFFSLEFICSDCLAGGFITPTTGFSIGIVARWASLARMESSAWADDFIEFCRQPIHLPIQTFKLSLNLFVCFIAVVNVPRAATPRAVIAFGKFLFGHVSVTGKWRRCFPAPCGGCHF